MVVKRCLIMNCQDQNSSSMLPTSTMTTNLSNSCMAHHCYRRGSQAQTTACLVLVDHQTWQTAAQSVYNSITVRVCAPLQMCGSDIESLQWPKVVNKRLVDEKTQCQAHWHVAQQELATRSRPRKVHLGHPCVRWVELQITTVRSKLKCCKTVKFFKQQIGLQCLSIC